MARRRWTGTSPARTDSDVSDSDAWTGVSSSANGTVWISSAAANGISDGKSVGETGDCEEKFGL